MPDELAACCVHIFGRQARKEWETRSDDEDAEGEARRSKKMKLDPVLEEGDKLLNAEAEFKNAVEAAGAFFIDPVSGVDVPMAGSQAPLASAKVEEIADDSEAAAAAEVVSEWAAAKADVDAAQSWMNAPVPTAWASEAADNPWGQPAGNDGGATSATWKVEVHSLMALLGPTSLPLTHKVGYVEESVRRVVSWSAPEPVPVVAADLGVEVKGLGTSDPMKKFARFVLAPHDSYSTAERAVIRAPDLLKDPNSPKKGKVAEPANVPPHDPLKDSIVVLLDARTTEHAFEGMAIGGTFVQLVPDGQDASQTSSSKKKSHSKKDSKSKQSDSDKPQTWWYAENVIQVLPSYWTEAKE